jgi:hypothetical protein
MPAKPKKAQSKNKPSGAVRDLSARKDPRGGGLGDGIKGESTEPKHKDSIHIAP